jgi:hypothetical protein
MSTSEAARRRGYRAIPVPPTFLQAITNDDPEKGGLLSCSTSISA